MRLLIVSQYVWPEAFRINEIIEYFRAEGHEVTVLTGTPSYPSIATFSEYRARPDAFSDYLGAKIIRVPVVGRRGTSFWIALNYVTFVISALTIGTWKLRGKSFDAIFVFQVSPITTALPAIWLRWLKRVPVSMWVLDLWPETLSAVGVVRSPWVLSMVRRVVAYVYRHCDLILAQSKGFVPRIKKYDGVTARIEYLPAWVESIYEKPLDDIEGAEEVDRSGATFNVMFAGNIGEAQDFPAILEAAARTRHVGNLRWYVVGDGRAAPWVREEIARRELGDRVIMLGRQPAERMPSFFKQADALLVSLRDEPIFAMTIPGKLQTYLSVGRPVVAMLGGEGARVVEESGAGLAVPPGDSKALADAVLKLAESDAAERNRMSLAGITYSREHFSRHLLLKRLEDWLIEMAGSGRPGN